MSDPATDALIAARWPAEWAKANDKRLPNRSKKRQQLRLRHRRECALIAFRLANPLAVCDNCSHVNRRLPTQAALACDLDSDFHGYQIVRPAHVCVRWERSPPLPAIPSAGASTVNNGSQSPSVDGPGRKALS